MIHYLDKRRDKITINRADIAKGFEKFLNFTHIDNFLVKERLFLQIDNELIEEFRLV